MASRLPPEPFGPDRFPEESPRGGSSDEFVRLLTGAQVGLFRYICGLVGDPNDAGNILQEANIVLWRKAEEFRPGTSFDAWARSVALWQVKAWLRDRGRDRHVFSSELVSQLVQRPIASKDIEPSRRALRVCVQSLNEGDKKMLVHRYFSNSAICEIAEQTQKTPAAVKSCLFRIRKSLRRCIERRLSLGSEGSYSS
ncbi:MAG: sigma-70 family RNA polymerase sigma factor [Planctomycetales bacterium]|nr:sigma-70 family RNA polymerase sigma factor [Planctomycetales bacterium]